MSYRLGCVPYVNAIPLVRAFEAWDHAKARAEVVYAVPSELPKLLESGEVDAILVSTFYALTNPGLRMADGIGIASDGLVKSVRLFSKVAPHEIKSLCLDQSSMTSNALAQIILNERYGVKPTLVKALPSLDQMLEIADACVIIGDEGMAVDAGDLFVLDLGDEWKHHTGKPFVWATWVGREGLTPALAMLLQTAAHWSLLGQGNHPHLLESILRKILRMEEPTLDAPFLALKEERLHECIVTAKHQVAWPDEAIRDYLENVMIYNLDALVMDGLRMYQEKLLANGFENAIHFPALIGGSVGELSSFLERT